MTKQLTMTDYNERLKNLDDHKLIDVVKNYRQYGYDDKMRATAMSILNERGITKEELQLTGSYDNKTYDDAQQIYNSFVNNSKFALILYLVMVTTSILGPISATTSESISNILFICNLISAISFVVFLIKSFLNQNLFYKTCKQEYGTEGVVLYLLLGMPFYVFMYFYFRNQMKEKMKEIK